MAEIINMQTQNPGKPNLRFNMDNAVTFEVELQRGFSPEKLPEELKEQVDKENGEFISNMVIPVLMQNALNPCSCRQQELMMRAIQKPRIVTASNMNPMPTIELTQEDIDMWDFSVVLAKSAGKLVRLVHITQHCKKCNRLLMFGDSPVPTAHQVAMTIINNESIPFDDEIPEEKPETESTGPQ